MNITINNEKGMYEKLKQNNFQEVETKTPFEEYRFQRECSVIFYKTGKVLFQGSDMSVLQALSLIRGMKKSNPIQKNIIQREIIGSDETLKGDTFGGLVVAGFKGNTEIRSKLLSLGVRDSKLLSIEQIRNIALKLMEYFPNRISIISLMPEEYNKETEFVSITGLLNNLHQEAYKNLSPGFHVVDKYPGCKIGDEIIEKAESKYLEVAAASIIARFYGLKQFSILSSRAGFEIPRGSTHVKEGLKKLKELNLEKEKFVKLHFRNVLDEK